MQTLELSSSAAAAQRALLAREEQIRAQYRIMPGALVGSMLLATLVVLMMHERAGTGATLPWLLAVYLLALARFALWWRFRIANPGTRQIGNWGRLAVIAGGLSGIVWGAAGLLLHDGTSLSHQLFMLMAVTGLGVSSTYVTAPFLPAYLAYVVPAFLLAALPFFLAGDRVHVSIGAGALLLLVVAVHFAARLSRTFFESVRMRLQNSDLVEELRKQKEAAEAANVAKSRFLAVASHDLRQPLHALGLLVHALEDSSTGTHEKYLVGNIRRSVDAMQELFEGLLDISRLDAGVVRPRVQTFGLASVFERLSFEYAAVARQKSLTLAVMKTSVYVRSDPQLLERIIRNLVSNAVRYTERGGLVVGCRRAGAAVRIEVWDSGCGIPPEKHREVFGEFAQLESGGRAHRRGLGLGLAIVERLSQLLSHSIGLRSIQHKGSVFTITVPRGRVEDLIVSPAIEHTSAFDLSGVLILVIEDDAAVSQAMEALLHKWNAEVLALRSAAEMHEKLATLRRVPGLIISDYRPGADGSLALIELLRHEFNTEIPAMLITGDPGANPAGPATELAGLPVLYKPLNPARLRTLICNLLRIEASQERPRRVG